MLLTGGAAHSPSEQCFGLVASPGDSGVPVAQGQDRTAPGSGGGRGPPWAGGWLGKESPRGSPPALSSQGRGELC